MIFWWNYGGYFSLFDVAFQTYHAIEVTNFFKISFVKEKRKDLSFSIELLLACSTKRAFYRLKNHARS